MDNQHWPAPPPKPTHITVQGMRLPIINTRQAHLCTTVILAAATLAGLVITPAVAAGVAAYLIVTVWALRWVGPGAARGRHVEELRMNRAENWRDPR